MHLGHLRQVSHVITIPALGAIAFLGDESLVPPFPRSLFAEASEGLVPPLPVGSCPEPSALKNLGLV